MKRFLGVQKGFHGVRHVIFFRPRDNRTRDNMERGRMRGRPRRVVRNNCLGAKKGLH